jgi:hypothetical protein
MRGKLWLAVALLPALMAMQCFHLIRVQVAPGPAVDDPPSFGFAYRGDPLTVVESFRVSECRGGRGAVWQIQRDARTPTDTQPLRITYGRVPRGYREAKPAEPLAPGGCYDARARGLLDEAAVMGGFGSETFHLLPNRRMFVGSPGGLATSSRPFRQLNRAAVGCQRGYRRARTQADSAAVDAREYGVLDARLSCGWLYATWPDLMEDPVTTEHGLLAVLGVAGLVAGVVILDQVLPDPPD